ncbi:MAG: hypothetical protein OEY36_10185 [Gammaproteobacteria bacterium]|nr:hypothetical protein [Gammaproteobacteria bacterium]
MKTISAASIIFFTFELSFVSKPVDKPDEQGYRLITKEVEIKLIGGT